MAWYSAGTISIAANGTTATGAGTAFLDNVRVGDGLVVAGGVYEITNIASNTQLTFAPAFTGAAGAGKAYRIQPVNGYDKLLLDTFNEIRLNWSAQLSGLQSWAYAPTPGQARSDLQLGTASTRDVQTNPYDATAGRAMLTGAWGLGANGATHANGYDYGTLANVALFQNSETANPSLSASGLPDGYYLGLNMHRSAAVRARLMLLWGASPRLFMQTLAGSPATWRNAELWTTVALQKQATTQDATAGAVMINGAWGLGGEAPGVSATVELASRPIGFQYQTAGAGNPFPAAMASMNVRAARSFALAARNLGAYIYTYGDPVPYLLTLCHNRNMVGTVADIDGIPSGAIIETGTNANGSYTKFADGTLICKFKTATFNALFDTAIGSMWGVAAGSTGLGTSWSFPAAFADNPSVVAVSNRNSSTINFGTAHAVSSTSASWWILSTARTTANQVAQMALTAIGRWKV